MPIYVAMVYFPVTWKWSQWTDDQNKSQQSVNLFRCAEMNELPSHIVSGRLVLFSAEVLLSQTNWINIALKQECDAREAGKFEFTSVYSFSCSEVPREQPSLLVRSILKSSIAMVHSWMVRYLSA